MMDAYAMPEFAALPYPAEKPETTDAQRLALTLKDELAEAQAARKMVELRWLEDLRQYRGIYDQKTAQRLAKRKRSRVFYRLTTFKVDTMVARLMDLLFPQRLKNWSLEPTPDPILPEDVIASEIQEDMQAMASATLQQLMQAQANVEAMKQDLARQGLEPGQIRQQMLALAAQAEMGQAGAPGGMA